jgi:formylglycine-generating enzyme required for sulfatase activity
LSDCISDPTWSGSTGSEGLPANCIDWYSAFLFCIWDGGRLPTESEWEYAAVGGSNESLYAWGDEPVLTGQKDGGETYAVYNCLGDGSDADICDRADIQPVGSRRDGAGRWEHLDLNGSIAEWTFDWAGDYPFADQTNYANLEETFERVRRGGGWSYDANLVTSVVRAGIEPTSHDVRAGIRCARSP